MRTPRHLLALTAFAVLSGCSATLTSFVVPTIVPAGRVFEVVVTGSWFGIPGQLGCVLQLPTGFTIVGSINDSAVVLRDDPTVLGAYTAEPGHYLASWSAGSPSGSQPTGTSVLKVWLRAPAATTTGTVKVSLGGTNGAGTPFAPSSPANITNFAQITATPHACPIAVTSQPTTAFAREDILWSPQYPAGAYGVTLTDIDRDGNDDLTSWSIALQTQVWFAHPGANWTQSSPPNTAYGAARGRVACGDFDGDGFVDLVESDGRVFHGNGAGGWTMGTVFSTLGGGSGVAVGDINHDGRDDVAIGSQVAGSLRAWFGNANRTFTLASNGLPNQSIGTVDGGRQLLIRDVTGDGELDLVWTRAAMANVWAGDGLGNWTPGAGLAGPTFHGAAAGDLDGNGTLELLFGVRNDGTGVGGGVAIYQRLAGNPWSPMQSTGLPSTNVGTGVAVLDYDRDGDADVAVGYAAPGGIELYENLGAMTFALVPNTGLPMATLYGIEELTSGDIDGDTFPDLAAAIPFEFPAVWQNWRSGLSTYGNACQGTLPQVAAVTTNSAPSLGNATFAMRVVHGLPGTIGFGWLGSSKHTWNGAAMLPFDLTPLGAAGCTLLAAPEAVATALFDAQGAITIPVPIPANPALLRQTVFAQGAAFAAGSNSLGLAFTAGLAIRIQ